MGRKIAQWLRSKSLAIVKENMFVEQLGNYLLECGLICPLFSKDAVMPSCWHFLRKAGDSSLPVATLTLLAVLAPVPSRECEMALLPVGSGTNQGSLPYS